jgi:hypothetical protein
MGPIFHKGAKSFKTFVDDFLKKILFYTMKFDFGVINKFKILKIWWKIRLKKK